MPIVDDRGRIFGRANLLDAFTAVVVLILIPLAYGSYLLFRTPPPKLLSVVPAIAYQGPDLRIEITGVNLRPFMRVTLNTIQARSFLIGSTKQAFIDLPDLPPGTYDVALFDYMEQLDQLPKALTILPRAPLPAVEVEVGGAFIGLSEADARAMKAGTQFPPTGAAAASIVSTGQPTPGALQLKTGDVTIRVPLDGQRELPATLRVKCYVESNSDGSLRCTVPGPAQASLVAPSSMLTLPGPSGWVNFTISEVHPTLAPPLTRARVRFVVSQELLAKIKAGDSDSSPKAAAQFHRAAIVSLAGTRAASAAETGISMLLGNDLRVLEATLSVPVEPGPGGWTYKHEPFKTGAPFTFQTSQYLINGVVADVSLPAAGPQPSSPGR